MPGIRLVFLLLTASLLAVKPLGAMEGDAWLSKGRQPDSSAKTISEIRAAEMRRIPLDVMLKTSDHYSAGGPVVMTILITNLFDAPLLMNSRMLVNHLLLQGEISFRITGPDGRKVEIKRLITPLSLRENDFVTLTRGQSFQRTVDLSDLYGISQKGIYKVQVSYHNEIDHTVGSQRVWKGIVWSDPIEIQLD
jgi:hypothetical protein